MMIGFDRQDEKSIQIKNYLNTLEILSKSTEAYLFLWDIRRDENWFFGAVDQKYELRDKGIPVNTIAEMEEIVYPPDRKQLHEDLQQIIDGKKKEHNMDYRWMNRQGQAVWINCRGEVIDDEDGNPFIMIGRVSDTLLRYLYHPLTRLFNKTKLMDDMRNDTHMSEGKYFMLLDVDDLGDINLKYGREYGDEVLKFLGKALEEIVPSQKIYHVERDGFAVCLDAKTEDEVWSVYQKLQQTLEEKCTVSVGVVLNKGEVFREPNHLYESAEYALKKAKTSGKNTMVFFSEEDMARKISMMQLLVEMQQSVKHNCEGFYLCYQPQVKSGSYKLYAAEALLRYTSKRKGRVFPDQFIPLLEDFRLIIPVGKWVLEQALIQCKKWRESCPEFRISVNFSTIQLQEKDIGQKVLDILAKIGLPGEALTIEITESVKLQEIQYYNNIFRMWRDSGIEISIDDFGTGYANMSYLKDLEVDEIKIDRYFVKDIQEATYNYKLVNNIIDFAKTNSLRICCEGVEDVNELAVLEGLSPNLLQGYLFDKPCESDEFERVYIDKETSEYKKRKDFVQELYQYKGKMHIIHFDPKDILRNTEVGLWIIRINSEEQYFEMHADETMEYVLAVDKKYTPQECYDFWHDRIKEDYVGYVNENVNRMMHTDKVIQLQYPWMHPVYGEIIVRCSGKRVEDSDGMITIEGYHRIINNIEETNWLNS